MAQTPEIIGVGGGKGGVGKSIFALTMAVVLAEEGERVVLVDLDLGAANLHTYLGIHGHIPTLSEFLSGKIQELSDLMVETSVPNLHLIAGSTGTLQTANPTFQSKMKLLRHIRRLPASFVVSDLGAGTNYNTLDFFNTSHFKVVVTQPEAGAVLNAYGFIKAALIRYLIRLLRDTRLLAREISLEVGEDTNSRPTLESVEKIVMEHDPELLNTLREVRAAFVPFLILNRAPAQTNSILVKNLLDLSQEKLGLSPVFLGTLPDIPVMSRYIINIPAFLKTKDGMNFRVGVQRAVGSMLNRESPVPKDYKTPQPDEEGTEKLIDLIDSIDDTILPAKRKKQLKLRAFFKPAMVIKQLEEMGITIPHSSNSQM